MGVFDAHSIYLERFCKIEFFSRNLISGIWQMLKLVRYQIPDFQFQTKISPNFAKNGQICVFDAHWAYPDRFSKFEIFSKNLHFSWFWFFMKISRIFFPNIFHLFGTKFRQKWSNMCFWCPLSLSWPFFKIWFFFEKSSFFMILVGPWWKFRKKFFPIFSISLCGSIMSSHKSPNLKYHLNWSIKS